MISPNATPSLSATDAMVDQWGQFTPDEWAGLETSGPAAAFNITHSYDPVGNRLLQNSAGQLTSFAYDAANQLTTSHDASGPTTYSYDATGNLALQNAPAGRTTYALWDIENRQTELWLPASVTNTMIYNADGLRMAKTDSASSQKFVWDQQNLLQETNNANVTQAAFTLKPDSYGSLLSQRRSGASQFYHFDGLRSTIGLSDITQTITDAYLYQAYGASAGQFGSTVNPFQWVGKLGYFLDNDPLQYYVRARNYSPALARWLSEDPLVYLDGALYKYGANSPLLLVDPSGEVWVSGEPAVCVVDERVTSKHD